MSKKVELISRIDLFLNQWSNLCSPSRKSAGKDCQDSPEIEILRETTNLEPSTGPAPTVQNPKSSVSLILDPAVAGIGVGRQVSQAVTSGVEPGKEERQTRPTGESSVVEETIQPETQLTEVAIQLQRKVGEILTKKGLPTSTLMAGQDLKAVAKPNQRKNKDFLEEIHKVYNFNKQIQTKLETITTQRSRDKDTIRSLKKELEKYKEDLANKPVTHPTPTTKAFDLTTTSPIEHQVTSPASRKVKKSPAEIQKIKEKYTAIITRQAEISELKAALLAPPAPENPPPEIRVTEVPYDIPISTQPDFEQMYLDQTEVVRGLEARVKELEEEVRMAKDPKTPTGPDYKQLYQDQLSQNRALRDQLDQWSQKAELQPTDSYFGLSPNPSCVDNSFDRQRKEIRSIESGLKQIVMKDVAQRRIQKSMTKVSGGGQVETCSTSKPSTLEFLGRRFSRKSNSFDFQPTSSGGGSVQVRLEKTFRAVPKRTITQDYQDHLTQLSTVRSRGRSGERQASGSGGKVLLASPVVKQNSSQSPSSRQDQLGSKSTSPANLQPINPSPARVEKEPPEEARPSKPSSKTTSAFTGIKKLNLELTQQCFFDLSGKESIGTSRRKTSLTLTRRGVGGSPVPAKARLSTQDKSGRWGESRKPGRRNPYNRKRRMQSIAWQKKKVAKLKLQSKRRRKKSKWAKRDSIARGRLKKMSLALDSQLQDILSSSQDASLKTSGKWPVGRKGSAKSRPSQGGKLRRRRRKGSRISQLGSLLKQQQEKYQNYSFF